MFSVSVLIDGLFLRLYVYIVFLMLEIHGIKEHTASLHQFYDEKAYLTFKTFLD